MTMTSMPTALAWLAMLLMLAEVVACPNSFMPKCSNSTSAPESNTGCNLAGHRPLSRLLAEVVPPRPKFR